MKIYQPNNLKYLILVSLFNIILNAFILIYSSLNFAFPTFLLLAPISILWVFIASIFEQGFSFFRTLLLFCYIPILSFVLTNFNNSEILLIFLALGVDLVYIFYFISTSKKRHYNQKYENQPSQLPQTPTPQNPFKPVLIVASIIGILFESFVFYAYFLDSSLKFLVLGGGEYFAMTGRAALSAVLVSAVITVLDLIIFRRFKTYRLLTTFSVGFLWISFFFGFLAPVSVVLFEIIYIAQLLDKEYS